MCSKDKASKHTPGNIVSTLRWQADNPVVKISKDSSDAWKTTHLQLIQQVMEIGNIWS